MTEKKTKKTDKKTEAVENTKVDNSEKKLVKATAKTVRFSPRKVRYTLDLIRGKNVDEALDILTFLTSGPSDIVKKVVKSAAANAKNNHYLDETKLYIKECYADAGFVLKRYMPRAKGSASSINKRTSHITVVVCER